jgi:hypothetical protein
VQTTTTSKRQPPHPDNLELPTCTCSPTRLPVSCSRVSASKTHQTRSSHSWSRNSAK